MGPLLSFRPPKITPMLTCLPRIKSRRMLVADPPVVMLNRSESAAFLPLRNGPILIDFLRKRARLLGWNRARNQEHRSRHGRNIQNDPRHDCSSPLYGRSCETTYRMLGFGEFFRRPHGLDEAPGKATCGNEQAHRTFASLSSVGRHSSEVEDAHANRLRP